MTRTTLLLALALTGCGEAGWESGGAGRWASGPWDPDDVAGIWTLTGDGSREDCRDERYDTDELHLSSLPLHVEQDHDVLTLAEELAGFTFFDGRVDLFGVTFSTRDSPIATGPKSRTRGLASISRRPNSSKTPGFVTSNGSPG